MEVKNALYDYIPVVREKEFRTVFYSGYQDEDWTIKNHYHNIYEVVLYQNITGFISLNGVNRSIQKHQLLFMPPYTVHGFTLPKQYCQFYVLHLSPDFTENLPIYPDIISLNEKDFTLLKTLLSWSSDMDYNKSVKIDAVSMFLNNIRNRVNKHYENIHESDISFKPLLRYIDENSDDFLTLIEAAKLCNMSRTTFINKFKKQFNMSYHNFLTDKRVEKAQYLLSSTNKTCAEIAMELGFSDASHFTKVFKKKTGVLPKNYQN